MKKRALAIVMAGLNGSIYEQRMCICKRRRKRAKTEGFYIGLSNGYWGNTWRAQMVEDFENRQKNIKKKVLFLII